MLILSLRKLSHDSCPDFAHKVTFKSSLMKGRYCLTFRLSCLSVTIMLLLYVAGKVRKKLPSFLFCKFSLPKRAEEVVKNSTLLVNKHLGI